MVEVYDLVRPDAVEHGLDGGRVVGLAVALAPRDLTLTKAEAGRSLVLRLRAGEDLAAGLVEERGGLGGRPVCGLCTDLPGVPASGA